MSFQNILPHAREDLAISSMPNGKAKYTASIRYHCDESIDPEVIHILGLKEVEKTKSKIKEVRTKSSTLLRNKKVMIDTIFLYTLYINNQKLNIQAKQTQQMR